MGQVPTTAHTLGPMALTSETTGPTGACTQRRPPSDVTHRGTVPWADGRPAPQVAVGGVGELELGREIGGQGVVDHPPGVAGVVGHGQDGGGPVEGQAEAPCVADEDHVGEVGQGNRRPHGQRVPRASRRRRRPGPAGWERGTVSPMTRPSGQGDHADHGQARHDPLAPQPGGPREHGPEGPGRRRQRRRVIQMLEHHPLLLGRPASRW